jgi:integrase
MAGIYKRGKVWWARIERRGKEYRKSLETASERVARERLLTFIADVKVGKWVDKKRRTFEEAASKFIDEHFPRIKPNSRKRYRVSLMNLHDLFRIVFLDEITSAVLSDFEVARRKQGVSNGTIRRDLMCLSSLFSCARDWEWLTDNPAAAYLRKAKKRGLVEAEPRARFLSHDEEARFIAYAAAKRQKVKGNRDIHGWQMREAAIAFALDTGLRSEEQFSLGWPMVDLDAGEVKVIAVHSKNNRSRRVPLFERTRKLLEELPRSEHSDFVFWHRSGQRYTQMYHPLQHICEDIKVTDLEWHDLRRTCGVRLLRDHHMSMEQVSLWLGHNNINITEKVYAFLDADDLHKAVSNSPLVVASKRRTTVGTGSS